MLYIRFFALLCVFQFIVVTSHNPVQAQSVEYSLESWRHNAGKRAGLKLSGQEAIYSSPAVYNLDGDSSNGLEVVIAGSDGLLHAVKADGTTYWQTTLPIYGCTGASDTNKVLSSPAVGELFGDGVPYVVIGYGGVGYSRDSCPGGVAAYNGRTGERRWIFDLKRFSRRFDFWSFSYTVFSTPALADTNGNGKLEIGFGAFDRNVYLLNARGKAIWYYQAADTVWSSATFVNANKNKKLEMVIGTDISRNDVIDPPTKDGGYVYAFKTTRGRRVKRKRKRRPKTRKFNFRESKAFVWKQWFPQTIYSEPAIADVLPNNSGPEIIVGSGCFFPQASSSKRGRWIKILDEKTGEVLQTLDSPTCTESSPAVGDIDGDGQLEIVATVNGSRDIGGDGNSRLIAWDPDVTTPLWEVIPRNGGDHDSYGAHFQSPVIGDLDGNGSQEIVINHTSGVLIFEGATGTPLTCNQSGCENASLKLRTGETMRSTPTIADIDADGDLELIIASGRDNTASGYAFTGFSEFLGSRAGPLTPNRVDWGSWRGNASKDGVYQSRN